MRSKLQLIGILGFVAGLLNACGSSKVSQCNAFIAQINQTSVLLTRVQTTNRPPTQPTETVNTEELGTGLDLFGQELAKNIKTMEAIGVDAPMQPLKTRLIASYKTALTNSQAFSQAIKTQNQAAAQTAQNQLMQASANEKQLLKEFTTYCQAPETK